LNLGGLLAVCALQAACTLGEQRAARGGGDGFPTGNAAYDDFFSAVRDVKKQAVAAPIDAVTGHAELMKALGLDAKATSDAAITEAGSRAKKLQDKGVLLHLEIAPEPKVLAAKGKGEVGADGEALFKAMEATLKTSIETRKKLAAIASRIADLEKKRAELRDKATATFKDDLWKRDDVVTELDATKKVLANAGDGAAQVDGAESRFVVDLVYAVETGGGTHPENSKTPPPPSKRAWATRAKSAAAPGVEPPSAPATPVVPKKKPKGGDDFEP
jgi:hypothetical protein